MAHRQGPGDARPYGWWNSSSSVWTTWRVLRRMCTHSTPRQEAVRGGAKDGRFQVFRRSRLQGSRGTSRRSCPRTCYDDAFRGPKGQMYHRACRTSNRGHTSENGGSHPLARCVRDQIRSARSTDSYSARIARRPWMESTYRCECVRRLRTSDALVSQAGPWVRGFRSVRSMALPRRERFWSNPFSWNSQALCTSNERGVQRVCECRNNVCTSGTFHTQVSQRTRTGKRSTCSQKRKRPNHRPDGFKVLRENPGCTQIKPCLVWYYTGAYMSVVSWRRVQGAKVCRTGTYSFSEYSRGIT